MPLLLLESRWRHLFRYSPVPPVPPSMPGRWSRCRLPYPLVPLEAAAPSAAGAVDPDAASALVPGSAADAAGATCSLLLPAPPAYPNCRWRSLVAVRPVSAGAAGAAASRRCRCCRCSGAVEPAAAGATGATSAAGAAGTCRRCWQRDRREVAIVESCAVSAAGAAGGVSTRRSAGLRTSLPLPPLAPLLPLLPLELRGPAGARDVPAARPPSVLARRAAGAAVADVAAVALFRRFRCWCLGALAATASTGAAAAAVACRSGDRVARCACGSACRWCRWCPPDRRGYWRHTVPGCRPCRRFRRLGIRSTLLANCRYTLAFAAGAAGAASQFDAFVMVRL